MNSARIYQPGRQLGRTYNLAQVNGWGSAGQCPASHTAKTTAAREQVSRVAGEKDITCASVRGGEVA